MFANERRTKIIEILNLQSSVTASELMETFRVSIETIRRDLEYLEQQGALKRVHGGAVTLKKMLNYTKLSSRAMEHLKEKRQLAWSAASLIEEGDQIALDTGSTAIELAPVLCERFHDLTVITSSLEVFGILSLKDSFHVILTGGAYQKSEKCFYGHLTLDMIHQLHVGKYFFTPAALSLTFGISDFVHEMISVQRAMLSISDQVFVLADSSKYETSAGYRICDLNPRYTYLSDSGLSGHIRDAYAEKSILIQ